MGTGVMLSSLVLSKLNTGVREKYTKRQKVASPVENALLSLGSRLSRGGAVGS